MDFLPILDVDGVFDLVGTRLKLPKLAELFKEQDIDGSVLSLLTTANIQQFLPSVTLGQCLKFFEGLKKYQEQCKTSSNVIPAAGDRCASPNKSVNDLFMTSSPRSPSPPSSPLCLRLPESPSSSPTVSSPVCPPSPACRQPLTPLPSAGNVFEPTTKGTQRALSTTLPSMSSRSCPMPKEFPVDKLEIAFAGRNMITTGTVTLAGKCDITNAVLSLLLKYSTSDGYVPFSLKRLAASSLVHTYPSLTMGLSVKNAVDAWHKSLSQKLINWRKRGKVSDPKMAVMKEKHRKRRHSEADTSSPSPKRRHITSRQTESVALTEEEMDEQTLLKQELAFEMSKPASSRNMKILENQSRVTYKLRRKFVLEETPHAHSLLREWPSLRNETIILKEMNLIEVTANSFPVFQSHLTQLTSTLMTESRLKARSYPKTHPLVELLEQIPQTPSTVPEYHSDLNIIGAVSGLTYLLPTTTKKTVYPHKYLIDVCAVNTTLDEIRKSVPDRDQPFIMIFGNVSEPRKIVIYVDKEPVCQFSSVARALYGLLSAHYMLNVAYSLHVGSSLDLLQDMCLGLPMVKPQTKVRDMKRKLADS